MATLFKVWSLTARKAVMASSVEELVSSGKNKLNLQGDVSLYMEDGTEVDDNDILSALPTGTVIYLLTENDPRPWQQSQIVAEYVVPDTQAVPEIPEQENIIESSSLTQSLEFIQRNLLLPWPKTFRIPDHLFSSELTEALSSGILCWRVKSELLGHLSREISKYTYKPSITQRDQVAKELIFKFPSLKSNIGDGHHAWSQKIYDKMCEESKRRATGGKRAAVKGGVKCVKLPRRGEINFAPPSAVDFEQTTKSKQILMDEALNATDARNLQAIEEHMLITFSDRRRLVSTKILVSDLKMEYPILFSELGIKTDFRLVNGFELEPRFFQQLEKCCEKVKEEGILMKINKKAVKKRISDSLENILNDNLPSDVTALRLLPLLLSDKDETFLYKIYPIETDKEHIKTSGPQTPHVAVLGHLSENGLCFIVVEGDIVFYVNGFVKALMLMFGTYYCCNMKYAPEVCRTLQFFQLYLLQITESLKPPSKLLTFCKNLP